MHVTLGEGTDGSLLDGELSGHQTVPVAATAFLIK